MPILGIIASNQQGRVTDTGAYFPLQVITVGSAGASSITFSNIPNTYTHLQIRGIGKTTADDGFNSVTTLSVRCNGDSTSGNYVWHLLYGNGSSAGALSSTIYGNQDKMGIGYVAQNGSGITNIYAGNIIDVLDYTNTNKYKTFRSLSGQDHNNVGNQQVELMSGLWLSTSAITSITLLPNDGNFVQYSSFALYGIKAGA